MFKDKKAQVKSRILSIPVMIFIVSVIFKVLVLFLTKSYINPEAFECETVASNILAGKGFSCLWLGSVHYLAGGPPLYIGITTIIYFIFSHSYLAMMIMQAFFASFLAVVVYKIAVNLMDKKAALVAAVLTMFHPGIFYYDLKKLHPLSLDCLIFALIIFFTIKLKDNRKIINYLILGIVLGLGALERGSFIFWLGFLALWVFFMARQISSKLKNRLALTFLVFLMMAVTVLPWLVRNYRIYHKVAFSQYYYNFFIGNNDFASGSNYSDDKKVIFYEVLPRDLSGKICAMPELEQNAFFKDITIKYIKEHPKKFLNLFFKKIFYFWWFAPQTGVLYPHLYLAIYKVYYLFLFLFALLGMGILFVRQKFPCLIILLFFASVTLSHAINYVEIRHRWGIEPLLFIFTAAGIFYAKEKIAYYTRIK